MKQQTLFSDVPRTPSERILQCWNETFSNKREIKKHTKITSKVLKVKNRLTLESYWKTLDSVIQEAFFLGFSEKDLIESITNYKLVIGDPKTYYYSVNWELAKFIYSGLHGDSGFVKFLGKNKPFEKLRYRRKKIDFHPITEKYDPQKVFNVLTQTYFGFPLDKIKNFKLRKKYLDSFLDENHNELNFTYFCELELQIAAFLFNHTTEDFEKYLDLWEKNRDKFAEKAKNKLRF